MDRGELLAAIADARPGPADVVYVERRGEDYGCRVTSPEEDLLLGGGRAEFPDVWIYWSGDWPADDPDRQRAALRRPAGGDGDDGHRRRPLPLVARRSLAPAALSPEPPTGRRGPPVHFLDEHGRRGGGRRTGPAGDPHHPLGDGRPGGGGAAAGAGRAQQPARQGRHPHARASSSGSPPRPSACRRSTGRRSATPTCGASPTWSTSGRRGAGPAGRSTAASAPSGSATGARACMLLGVIFHDSPGNARAFQQELGGDWPLLDDPKDRTLVDFGVRAPPETFVVDADGIIAVKFSGPLGPGQLDEVLSAERLAGKVPSPRFPGGVAEWFRQGSAKPCTAVQFRSPPLSVLPGQGHFLPCPGVTATGRQKPRFCVFRVSSVSWLCHGRGSAGTLSAPPGSSRSEARNAPSRPSAMAASSSGKRCP